MNYRRKIIIVAVITFFIILLDDIGMLMRGDKFALYVDIPISIYVAVLFYWMWNEIYPTPIRIIHRGFLWFILVGCVGVVSVVFPLEVIEGTVNTLSIVYLINSILMLKLVWTYQKVLGLKTNMTSKRSV